MIAAIALVAPTPIAVKLPGKASEKREVLLEGGQTQKLDVSPAPVVAKKEEPKPEPKEVVVEKSVSHISPLKAIGFTTIGVGATSAIAAIILGISAQDAGDAYNAAPTHAGYVHANALADWTTGAWITAGVLVATGVTLVLIPEGKSSSDGPKKEEKEKKPDEQSARLTITPTFGGLLVKGTF